MSEEQLDQLVARFRTGDYEGRFIGGYLHLYPDTALARRIRSLGSEALPVLHAALADEDELRVWDAAFCLGLVGSEKSVAPLIQAARRITTPEVRIAICRALANIGSEEAVPVLLELLESAAPQVDAVGDTIAKHHTVRWAAGEALKEITGDEYHFEGEEAFRAPAILRRQPFVCSDCELQEWEIEGGEWARTAEGIQGKAEKVGRLWLKRELPEEYRFEAAVHIREGTAGYSYGHLKDYLPSHHVAVYPGTWFQIEVSSSQVTGLDAPGESLSEAFLRPTWRSCAVGSRADLGDRISLFVSGGTAVFRGIRLEEGCEMLVDYAQSAE